MKLRPAIIATLLLLSGGVLALYSQDATFRVDVALVRLLATVTPLAVSVFVPWALAPSIARTLAPGVLPTLTLLVAICTVVYRMGAAFTKVAFLDRMYGAAEPAAYIVHGVGTGALRHALHEHLSRDETYVDGFRAAEQDEGGQQVTVVSLK